MKPALLSVPRGRACAILAIPVFGACTTFGSVRSADVTRGLSVDAAITVSTPPEDVAWFWSYGCVSCSRGIVAADLAFLWGGGAAEGPPWFELGGGLSGVHPYLHGYVQVDRGPRPWGVGARVGLSNGIGSWREDVLFGRFDLVLGEGRRLLLSPTLFRHAGNSPNGANPGSFIAFAQGVGYEVRSEANWVAPYATMVLGQVDRRSYGRVVGGRAAFLVLGFSMAFR